MEKIRKWLRHEAGILRGKEEPSRNDHKIVLIIGMVGVIPLTSILLGAFMLYGHGNIMVRYIADLVVFSIVVILWGILVEKNTKW